MTTLDLSDDFELLAPDLESVTFRRRGSTNGLNVERASRQQMTSQEAEPSGGASVQADAVWHLQLPVDEKAPQVGDMIVDQQKSQWTILETQQLGVLGRCKCFSRELRLAFGCHQFVDVLRPVWGDLGSGPEIVDWTEICQSVPVNIRLDELTVDSSTTPPTKLMRYEIIFSDSVALEPDDRFVDELGNSYRLESLTQAERIDKLPVAKAIREEESS